MDVAATSTVELDVAAERWLRAASAAADAVGTPSHGCDLDEAWRLSRNLVARAKHLDDLWDQDTPGLLGFQGALAPLFENVERTVARLIRTSAAGPEPNPPSPPAGEHVDPKSTNLEKTRSAPWPKQ